MPAITFRLDETDIAEASRVAFTAGLRTWWSAAVLVVLYLSLTVVTGQPLITLGGVAFMAVFWVFSMRVWMGWWGRRTFRQQRDLQHETRASWTPELLRLEMEAGESRTPWADFHRWRETGKVVLLYRSDAVYNVIPKRALTTAQMDELRALAVAAGVRGAAR